MGSSLENRVASVYAKDNKLQVGRWIGEGRLLFVDKRKSPEWATSIGLQLPKEGTVPGNKRRVLTEKDLVKDETGGGGTRFRSFPFSRREPPHGKADFRRAKEQATRRVAR